MIELQIRHPDYETTLPAHIEASIRFFEEVKGAPPSKIIIPEWRLEELDWSFPAPIPFTPKEQKIAEDCIIILTSPDIDYIELQ